MRTEAFRTALRELDEELNLMRQSFQKYREVDASFRELLRVSKGWRGLLLRGPLARFRKHYNSFMRLDIAQAEARLKALEKCRDSLEEAEKALAAGLPKGLRVCKR